MHATKTPTAHSAHCHGVKLLSNTSIAMSYTCLMQSWIDSRISAGSQQGLHPAEQKRLVIILPVFGAADEVLHQVLQPHATLELRNHSVMSHRQYKR